MALAVSLAPLVDEEHSVASPQQRLGAAAEVPDAHAPVAVAADVERVARFARIVVPRQLQAVPGFDGHPLRGQGHELVDEAVHLPVSGPVLGAVRHMMGLVLLPRGRIQHEAVDAVTDDEQQQQQDQQYDERDHGDLLFLLI